jgi:hypothetical protein
MVSMGWENKLRLASNTLSKALNSMQRLPEGKPNITSHFVLLGAYYEKIEGDASASAGDLMRLWPLEHLNPLLFAKERWPLEYPLRDS